MSTVSTDEDKGEDTDTPTSILSFHGNELTVTITYTPVSSAQGGERC